MPRRRVWLPLAILLGTALMFGAWTMWRAQGVLIETRERVASDARVRFTEHIIEPSIPAGLEFIGAPAEFRDAQMFHGHLFIAGPAGLAEYDADGALLARFRAGAELPAAPLTALAVGSAGDSHGEELWIATSGEGVVAFDGRTFRQIRPDDPKFRKVTAMLPLVTSRILFGTDKLGVLVYDGKELKPFHSSLSEIPVTALSGDDASLWVGTIDRGLLHWNAGTLETIDDNLPDRQVLSLAQDHGTVYAGTAMGVAEIRDGKFSRVLAPGYFAQSLLAADGKLWIGTLDEGMVEVPSHRAGVCPECQPPRATNATKALPFSFPISQRRSELSVREVTSVTSLHSIATAVARRGHSRWPGIALVLVRVAKLGPH